jgi:osmoprotectant transport system permease protein
MSFLQFLASRRAELFTLTAQHLVLVTASTAIAVAVGLPLGVAMTRLRRLARPILAAAGLVQTIPSLALFGFLIPLPLLGGIGARTALVALILYALLPILQNTYAGINQVDRTVLEAATALGMTPSQRLRMVELPLALPVILAGVRIAAVVSVGTATIAAAIGAGGLGTYVFRGIATVDTRLILAGAVPAAVLALLVDALLGSVERSRRPFRAAAALAGGMLLVLAAALAVARPSRGTAVVVGSKNFTEQVILGELVSQLLESRGFEVQRKLNLGGTNLCHQGVLSGELDAYVEYTGTALADILRQPAHSDPAVVLREVRQRYAALGLVVVEPLGFNNTYALVVRKDDAQRLGLRRISDLAPHAGTLRVGCFGEFLERPDGMKGLLAAYGFRFGPPPREMDLGLLYTALVNRQVDVAVGSATDGLIASLGLVVLEDDRRYFPPYDAVPITSERTLRRHPGLREALGALAGRIHEDAMRRMNYAVDGERHDPAQVAREFLRGAGLTRN